ncbi:MAG TPA: TonB family protein [Pyrinomonadaceae bacterium]|jgi:TonB family protein|nr:TonB family protein [Pyrinomonadaceae bacterium]
MSFAKLLLKNVLCAILLLTLAQLAAAQQTTADAKGPTMAGSANLTPAQIDDIIRKFTAKETQFRQALNDYAFKRDALVQEIGMGGQVIGEYHRISDFTFDNKGTRYEKINFFPMPSFQSVQITNEDLEDLGGVNPFALEGAKAALYNFKYVGKERIDELDLYVFDVAPKVMPDPKSKERVFVGRIWVDDHDLQIVKAKGKAGPETKKNKFPVVETYREQIDGKYWFPTYVYADDDLVFDNGSDIRIRMRVKYTDFVVGRGKVTITEVGEAPETENKPQPQTQPQSNQPTQPNTTTTTTQPQASTETSDEKQPVEGGFLNGKAVSLPKAIYPDEARKTHEAGTVQVKVLVDEKGEVISAVAVFGPDVLRDAAVKAAMRAKFKPMIVDGAAVKVSGILTYDFVAQ